MSHIEKPNYTQIPNVVLDHWIKELTPTEFKILCYLCRKTFGWHKVNDSLSLRKISDDVGCSKEGVRKGLARLIELKIVEKEEHFHERGNQKPNTYEVKIHQGWATEKGTPRQKNNTPLKENITKETTLPKGRDRDCVEFDHPDVKPKKEIKNIFGENGQVRMTQEQYDRGKNDYPPGAWDEKLEELDYYIATNKKGSNYRNHNQVIRLWLKRDGILPLKGNKINHNTVIQQFKKKIKDLGITAHYEENENSLLIKVECRSWRLEKNSAIDLNSAAIVSQLVGDVNV